MIKENEKIFQRWRFNILSFAPKDSLNNCKYNEKSFIFLLTNLKQKEKKETFIIEERNFLFFSREKLFSKPKLKLRKICQIMA